MVLLSKVGKVLLCIEKSDMSWQCLKMFFRITLQVFLQHNKKYTIYKITIYRKVKCKFLKKSELVLSLQQSIRQTREKSAHCGSALSVWNEQTYMKHVGIYKKWMENNRHEFILSSYFSWPTLKCRRKYSLKIQCSTHQLPNSLYVAV